MRLKNYIDPARSTLLVKIDELCALVLGKNNQNTEWRKYTETTNENDKDYWRLTYVEEAMRRAHTLVKGEQQKTYLMRILQKCEEKELNSRIRRHHLKTQLEQLTTTLTQAQEKTSVELTEGANTETSYGERLKACQNQLAGLQTKLDKCTKTIAKKEQQTKAVWALVSPFASVKQLEGYFNNAEFDEVDYETGSHSKIKFDGKEWTKLTYPGALEGDMPDEAFKAAFIGHDVGDVVQVDFDDGKTETTKNIIDAADIDELDTGQLNQLKEKHKPIYKPFTLTLTIDDLRAKIAFEQEQTNKGFQDVYNQQLKYDALRKEFQSLREYADEKTEEAARKTSEVLALRAKFKRIR